MRKVTKEQVIDTIRLKYKSNIYFNVRLVAKLLCLHRNTVYMMVEQGKFDDYGGVHVLNIGTKKQKILVPKETLINFIDANLKDELYV